MGVDGAWQRGFAQNGKMVLARSCSHHRDIAGLWLGTGALEARTGQPERGVGGARHAQGISAGKGDWSPAGGKGRADKADTVEPGSRTAAMEAERCSDQGAGRLEEVGGQSRCGHDQEAEG